MRAEAFRAGRALRELREAVGVERVGPRRRREHALRQAQGEARQEHGAHARARDPVGQHPGARWLQPCSMSSTPRGVDAGAW